MGCESAKKSPDRIVPKVSSQHKQNSSKQDKGCRNNLASRYIDHMPYVQDCKSRLAVWSDIKEVLFPSCSDPECDIVLNALKISSRYPWEDSKMQPCTPKQQMNFLRNFRLVTSGTLLVDLQFVKDNIDELWEMAWLKHGTSLDASSLRCHYATMRRAENTKICHDRGPSDKENNNQECKAGMNRFVCKTRENQCVTGTLETCQLLENGDNTQTYIADDDERNFLDISHQLGNDCLTDCSSKKQHASTLKEEKSDKVKSISGYMYPTIETLRIIPRKDQADTSTNTSSIKTKHMGFIVLPVVKPGDKDSDDQTFSSGAEVSATFPQLHDYLERLSSEFIVGHTDSSRNVIRRCTGIEGRYFTNWKIRRHGWNLPWQHMTSKDIVVSWNSVVNQLQRLAGKAVDVNDILPGPTSDLISFKDPFPHLIDDISNVMSTYWIPAGDRPEQVCPSNVEKQVRNITLIKRKPEELKNPVTLYDICQAQLKKSDILKSVPRSQLYRMESKTVLSTTNLHHVQEQRNANCIPFIKARDSSTVTTGRKEGIAVHDRKQTTHIIGSGYNVDRVPFDKEENVINPIKDHRVPTLRTRTGTLATNSNARMGLRVKGDIETSNLKAKRILPKPRNVDKTIQPKKRQRVKSPTGVESLTRVKAGNNMDIFANTNKNALDGNCSESDIDGPTLTQLLSHQIPMEKLPVPPHVSPVYGKHSSTNQNALYRNVNDTPQPSNVFLRQMSASSKQSTRQSKLFQYPTSRSIDPLDRVTSLTGSLTHGETFHHLRKCSSFPKRTFEKYSDVWNRISDTANDQSAGRLLNTTSEPFKSFERVTTSTSKCRSKSKPQWNIDQIIKEHPRRIKGDSLYGISINKTQAHYASQLHNTSTENGTKTQYNGPCSESLQRQNINEVLPTVVKPKNLMLQTPSCKTNEAGKYQKKEIWYRNESLSRPKNIVHANNLLEMVSANPFNQTVESMIALRKFNCDFDSLRAGTSKGALGPRSSPLPKIDTDRVSTVLPAMTGKSDNSLCYQRMCDLAGQNAPSTTSELDRTETFPPIERRDCRKNTRRSHHFQNGQNIKAASIKTNTESSTKDVKDMSCSQQKDKGVNDLSVEHLPDELPRLSKSQNCLKYKGFKKQDASVCKSASSPGLQSNKYKVEMNDLTLRFTRLKDNRKEPKDDETRHQHKQSTTELKIKAMQCGRECQPDSKMKVGGKTHPTTRTGDEKQKFKRDDQFVGRIADENTKLCTQSHIKNKATGYCQMYDVDEITKTIESNTDSKETETRTDNGVDEISRPTHYLHNKKRWLIEYKQNLSNTLNSVEEEISTTQHSESLDHMTQFDSVPDERHGSIISKSNFHAVTVPTNGSLEDGDEAGLADEDQIYECKVPSISLDKENDRVLENLNIVRSISRDTTYSEMSDNSIPSSSDGILLVDNDEIDLIEEVVDHVESVSLTDVVTPDETTQLIIDGKEENNAVTPEENTQLIIDGNEENNHENQNDLNMQTRHIQTSAPESCVKDDTDALFEGSVYVFNDSKKGDARRGSSGGVNIIRRSVRQHLSPRKSMAEVSDKSIYSASERTTPKNTNRRKGKKSTKTKSASKCKTQLCASNETSTNELTYIKGQEKTLEASFGRSCVVTDRSPESALTAANTVFMDTDRSSKGTYTNPNSVVMDTDKFKEGTLAKKTPGEDGKTFSGHVRTEIETPNHCKVKQRNITKQDMATANSTIQHLAAEQRRMLDIIKQSSSSQSMPSPASSSPHTITNRADSAMNSSTFSFVPIYTRDHACKGGYAHMEGVTCPYVIMDGYKFLAIQDVIRMFPPCDKTCKVIKSVLVKYRGLSRTFCDWDQVYLLDQLFILKGRSVKTGDVLLRVDSLVKHLPAIRDHVREEHLKLRRKGKTTLQCVQQQH